MELIKRFGGVHAIGSVSEESTSAIDCWALLLFERGDGTFTRHLAGTAGFEGRVSSAVVNIDSVKMVARTKSGRRYAMVKPCPGRLNDDVQ